MFHEWDLPTGNLPGSIALVVSKFQPNTFVVYRTILQTTTYHLEITQGAAKALGPHAMVFVDPLELSLIARQSLSHGFGQC